MPKRIRFCPRCMAIIGRKDTKCPSCGMEVSKMQEEAEQAEKEKTSKQNEKLDQPDVVETDDGGLKVDTSLVLEKEEIRKNIAEEEAKEAVSEAEESEVGKVIFDKDQADAQPKRHKHKSKRKDAPEYSVDSNGEYNIDTSDVTYLEGVTYSAKKARGEYQPEKIKWWEIYKWADRMLAKRKIMKEVNKAARKTPVGIKRSTMIILSILFGWMGAHSFYAKNYKRGTVSLVCITLSLLVVTIQPLYRIMGIFVGGGCGFVVTAMWLIDIIAIIWGTYRYRISKLEFISNLNIETRAKIGKKYIHFDRNAFKAMEKKRMDKINKKREKKLKKKHDKLEKE